MRPVSCSSSLTTGVPPRKGFSMSGRFLVGWIFVTRAISDHELAYNEVAELKKTVLGLKRQLENVLHDKVAAPIIVARECNKRKPAGNSRAMTNDSVAKADARGSSRAPAQSKREARLLRQIFPRRAALDSGKPQARAREHLAPRCTKAISSSEAACSKLSAFLARCVATMASSFCARPRDCRGDP